MKLPAYGELGQRNFSQRSSKERLRVGMSLKHTMANKGQLVQEEVTDHLRLEAMVRDGIFFLQRILVRGTEVV